MLKYLLLFSGILSFALPATAQLIGSWFDLLSYRNAESVAAGDSLIYTATEQALFTYSLADFNVKKKSKANGLSDIGSIGPNVSMEIAYHSQRNLLLIAYTNGNIDLWEEGTIYNIPDIKNATFSGQKRINHIYFLGRFAYLSTSFGVVVIDLEKKEISDTYRIGPNGQPIDIFAVTSLADTLYAASAIGLYMAPNDPTVNLLNFANWTLDTARQLPAGKVTEVVTFEQSLYAIQDDKLYARTADTSHWHLMDQETGWSYIDLSADGPNLLALSVLPGSGAFPDDAHVARYNPRQQMQVDYPIDKSILDIPRQVTESNNGDIWVADFALGLIKFTSEGFAYIRPDGPASSSVFDMALYKSNLWAVPGGIDGAFGYKFNRDGIFSRNAEGFWYTFDQYNTPPLEDYLDIIVTDIDQQTGTRWFGSYYGGAIKMDDNGFTFYNKDNTALQAPTSDPARTTVSDVAIDEQGNAWLSNNFVNQPLVVITPEGNSRAFSFPSGVNSAADLAIDDFGTKWVAIPFNNNVGLVAYNHGTDLTSTADDQARALGSGQGNGNLHTNEVTAIEVDQDGEVWIGTNEGITVIYTPGSVFTGNADASRILVEQEEGEFNYLLESEIINCIAVDGANRKWIGTNNGAFLMSENGTEQISYFTAENSPLLNNQILDIEIDGQDGTVYFATSSGMVAYRGTATTVSDNREGCKIYPNPVASTYNGPITIDGVVNNGNVKITDIEGQLIWETTALGTRVIWDGNNYNGERAKTGVYLLFIANETGEETEVCKLLLIN